MVCVVIAVRTSDQCDVKDTMDRYVLHMNDNRISVETPKMIGHCKETDD
jgi:hypothetical protein